MSSTPRFLSLEILRPDSTIALDLEQSSHCVRVLRLASSDSILLIDGKGHLAQASILKADPHKTVVSVGHVEFVPRYSTIQLAFGITKPSALELIFRKCTELGLRSFQPLITEHSTKLSAWNDERWLKILVEACKQSQESWIPELQKPLKLSDWLRNRSAHEALIFCDENQRSEKNMGAIKGPLDILVGPEGGWSESERELLKSQPLMPLSLGPNRLRAETACLVALTLTKSKIQEL